MCVGEDDNENREGKCKRRTYSKEEKGRQVRVGWRKEVEKLKERYKKEGGKRWDKEL